MNFRWKASPIIILFLSIMVMSTPFDSPSAEPLSVQGPFFDPRTGSYFALYDRRDVIRGLDGPNWHEAHALAAKQIYKGRSGRLAVIPDYETMEFVKKNFKFTHATWIGLRYFCRFRKLLWTNGETQPTQANVGLWAPQWKRNDEVKCGSNRIEFMPVYLTNPTLGPIKFQAVGPGKRFYFTLVEYPKPPQADIKARKDLSDAKTDTSPRR